MNKRISLDGRGATSKRQSNIANFIRVRRDHRARVVAQLYKLCAIASYKLAAHHRVTIFAYEDYCRSRISYALSRWLLFHAVIRRGDAAWRHASLSCCKY